MKLKAYGEICTLIFYAKKKGEYNMRIEKSKMVLDGNCFKKEGLLAAQSGE